MSGRSSFLFDFGRRSAVPRGGRRGARRSALVAATSVLAAIAPATAATITAEELTLFGETITIISIVGEIAEGDHKRFAEVTEDVGLGSVMLDSPGGDLMTAIEIGGQIRDNGFITAVDWGAICTGECVLVWLGGTTLFVGHDAQVGLRSRPSRDDPRRPSIAISSLVGAYAGYLGYSTEFVAYLMTAPVDRVRWLTFDDADRYGLHVVPAVRPDEEEPAPE